MVTIFIFILGLAIGSFLNVCIDRLPHDETLQGRSHCDHCRKKLQGIDLIPVVSFILLNGKCRYCKKKLSLFYPFVEIVTGLSFLFVWLFVIASPAQLGAAISSVGIASSFDLNMTPRNDMIALLITAISYFGITSSLIVIFFADLKYHIIPDEATIAIILFTLPIVGARHALPLQDHILGGIFLFLIIYLLYIITRGRGMGFGDVKFAFAMGFLLGPKAGGIALYVSFILGGIVSLILILLNKRGMKSMIAFGPFMVIGIVLMLFFPEKIFSLVSTFLPIK